MEIRTLLESDIPIYWPFRLRALQEHPEAFGESYADAAKRTPEDIQARFQSSTENFILGAFLPSGELVGMVGFYREPRPKRRHKGTLWGTYVPPEARGQKIGFQLIQALIAKVRELPGLEQLNLSVVSTNQPARELYLSLGFQVYGQEPSALKLEGTSLDEDLMVLFLG